jgi:hypothetical protein
MHQCLKRARGDFGAELGLFDCDAGGFLLGSNPHQVHVGSRPRIKKRLGLFALRHRSLERKVRHRKPRLGARVLVVGLATCEPDVVELGSLT